MFKCTKNAVEFSFRTKFVEISEFVSTGQVIQKKNLVFYWYVKAYFWPHFENFKTSHIFSDISTAPLAKYFTQNMKKIMVHEKN